MARSPTVPGRSVRATALIEARLPRHAPERTADPLLRELLRTGRIREEVPAGPGRTHRSGLIEVAADGRIVDPALDGTPHPRRLALGPYTNARSYAAFARPRTDAPAFRQNDATARVLLRAAVDAEPSGGAVARPDRSGEEPVRACAPRPPAGAARAQAAR